MDQERSTTLSIDLNSKKHLGALIDDLASKVQCLPNTVFISMYRHRYLLGKFEEIPGSIVLAGGDESVEFRIEFPQAGH